MSTTKKTGGWAAVGEILVGLFDLWAKSKPPAETKAPSSGPLTTAQYDGAAALGVTTQELRKDPELRAKAGWAGALGYPEEDDH